MPALIALLILSFAIMAAAPLAIASADPEDHLFLNQ